MSLDFSPYQVIIVGCGLSGAVIAEQYANVLGKKVIVLDKRDHIGGNCYDFVDEETNIRCSKYGPHFFHTNDEQVWTYINRFGEWMRYDHSTLAKCNDTLVPIPVNITTVNTLCNEHLQTTEQMNAWLKIHQIQYDQIDNGEQMACSLVGSELYDKLFKNYTYKQWNRYPNELYPEVLARIPVRNNFDTRYFTDKYQVLPKFGYTQFINNILNHPNITVVLNTDFFSVKDGIPTEKIIIYTGPIDRYFESVGYEKLEYRSLKIVFERYKNVNFYQPRAVINYPDLDVSYTRITEYKHCLNQSSSDTIISKEYSCDDGEPYYPVLNHRNMILYEQYKSLATSAATNNIHFIGRLANYKYFNMDQAIKNALVYFDEHLKGHE